MPKPLLYDGSNRYCAGRDMPIDNLTIRAVADYLKVIERTPYSSVQEEKLAACKGGSVCQFRCDNLKRLDKVEPMLNPELQHREIIPDGGSSAVNLMGWVQVGASS